MTSYLVSVTQRLFPTCPPASLSPLQCRQLVTVMYEGLELVYLAGSLPEVVSRILSHLDVDYREHCREVCHAWNRLATDLRRVKEFSLITCASKYTIHIALHFLLSGAKPLPISGQYIYYARSQEEFDTLWPTVTTDDTDIWRLKRKYITPDKAQRAFTLTYTSRGMASALEWALRLPYRILCEINICSLSDTIITVRTVANVLAHLSHKHMEPRKIVWISHNTYLGSCNPQGILAAIADEVLHTQLTTNDSERYMFSLCPALGVYLYLYSPLDKWRPESVYVPPSLRSMKNLPLSSPTPEEFYQLYESLRPV